MAWATPKTDWKASFAPDGSYAGDWFNASDFNRIKNNVQYLYELALTMYEPFSIVPMGADRTVSDYIYADEMKQIEENLVTITEYAPISYYIIMRSYTENGPFPTFSELNYLENWTLAMYNQLINEYNGRRNFEWNFGDKGGEL